MNTIPLLLLSQRVLSIWLPTCFGTTLPTPFTCSALPMDVICGLLDRSSSHTTNPMHINKTRIFCADSSPTDEDAWLANKKEEEKRSRISICIVSNLRFCFFLFINPPLHHPTHVTHNQHPIFQMLLLFFVSFRSKTIKSVFLDIQ
jgi:hypothetical protein